ncbi:hypothetical protein, variant [Fonticula alba]|uniref:Calcineurin-like phosphoesterase domain-containing protein n=1 Tax=Fonticula alba TaxID=691883 RepID=A0A058Z9P4_FONAL|nr:hypothetical protein, variant [Fonticula alba]KCV70643.1 hypothetical protein, variant [Fonticula alba]|eukprot:XP_009495159.1 hypothetical protein, variant [Fonticula alba]
MCPTAWLIASSTGCVLAMVRQVAERAPARRMRSSAAPADLAATSPFSPSLPSLPGLFFVLLLRDQFFGQYMSSFSIPPRSPTPMLKHEDASTVASRDLGASLTTSVAPAVSGAVPHEEAERQGLLPKGDQKDPTAGTLSGAILSGGALEHQGFPYERPLPEHGVLIVGLSSAVPQRPHYAGGLLGKGQLDRLDAILKRPEYADMFKVVMVHHPPVPRYNNPNREQRDGLLDQEELCRILRLHRVDLTLNGHMHRTYFEPLPDTPTYSDGSPQSWVGEPGSCTFNSNYGPMRARYNIYEIADGRVQRVVSRFFVTPRDAAQEEKFSEHMLDEEVLYEAPNYVCQD